MNSTIREAGAVAAQLHPCDLCGATDTSRLHVLRDTTYGAPGSYDVVRCLGCGLVYLTPQPPAELFEEVYPPEYDCHQLPSHDEGGWPVRLMRQRRLASQRRMVEGKAQRHTGAILDVGCSTGLFLDEMSRHGWQVLGVEPSAAAAQAAAREHGIPVMQGLLAEAALTEGSCDVITYWQVLEHTRSPCAELRRIYKLLKPGGLFMATVPNHAGLDRLAFGRHWQGYDCPRHLFAFSRPTLTAYLTQAGFERVSTSCIGPGYYALVPSMVRAISARHPQAGRITKRLLLLPGIRFVFQPFIAVTDLLGRGPILLVTAEKSASSA